MKKIIPLIISCSVLATTQAQSAMYRYVDENGQVVYTQFRPGPGVDARTIKGPPPPPTTAKQSQQNLIDSLQEEAEAREDEQEASDEAEKQKTAAKRQKKNCEIARNNLKYLQAQDNRKLVDKDGNELTLNDNQRQQRIEKAREVMQRDCK